MTLSSRWAWRGIIALGVVLIALLATSVVLAQRHPAAKVDESAIAVGKQEALNFFDLDHDHIDADIASVLSLAANPFKANYAAKAASIKAGVVARDLTIHASVPANSAGLEYQSGDTAVVLVAVDETITTSSSAGSAPATQSNRYRMRLHLTKLDGAWRVTQVQQVG